MAVPSSGALSMLGIWSEKNESDYSAASVDGESSFSLLGLSRDSYDDSISQGTSILLNTSGNDAADQPDQDAPHAMSEFYSYDHDAAVTYDAYLAEDWGDGAVINAGNDTDTDTRTLFNVTDFEDATDRPLYLTTLGETNTSTGTVNDRPIWSTYGTPSINTNAIRFTNTNQTYGMFCKTTDHTTLTINNVPTDECVAWRWRFFMNTTNNKDHTSVIRMSTSNHTNPAVALNSYIVNISDNADPATGEIALLKRINSTTQTEIGATAAGVYTLGTTQDFVLSWHREGSGRSAVNTWKVGMAPTTTPTALIIKNNSVLTVDDSTYFIAYGWSLRTPKAMSVPTSTHYHEIDNASITKLVDPTE